MSGESGKTVLLICLTSIALPAQAQYQNPTQSSGQSLENMLDAVESTANWSKNNGAQYQSNPYPAQSGQFQQRPIYNKPFLNQGVPCHVPMRSVPSLPVQNLSSLGQQNQSPTGHISPGQMTFRLLRAANSVPSSPRGGGAGRSRGFGGSGGGSASDNFYRAQDQADRAREAYDRSWHGDKYNREQAAEEAQYAAREARREADEAFSKADSGDPNARTYAEKALAAAEDAQSYADKAETNAERAEDNSRRGW
ncbi:MAG: hypothetical protein K2Y32_14940 [Candidatus Obscuribacterales bacterium]|nr:hypothetical protein [Candidatus Obscuribacterales bacterium]